jgi:hypothetical protein
MIGPPAGVRVYLACGVTDMRKGMIGLAMLVQQVLADDPFSGALWPERRLTLLTTGHGANGTDTGGCSQLLGLALQFCLERRSIRE